MFLNEMVFEFFHTSKRGGDLRTVEGMVLHSPMPLEVRLPRDELANRFGAEGTRILRVLAPNKRQYVKATPAPAGSSKISVQCIMSLPAGHVFPVLKMLRYMPDPRLIII